MEVPRVIKRMTRLHVYEFTYVMQIVIMSLPKKGLIQLSVSDRLHLIISTTIPEQNIIMFGSKMVVSRELEDSRKRNENCD
jgi:hypothetical protein